MSLSAMDVNILFFAWSANVLIVLGMIFIAQRQPPGFVLTASGNIVWSAIGWTDGNYALVALCLVLAGIAAHGYCKWINNGCDS
jgi:hypothetical protein